jgi:hypothetical protein
MRQMLNVVLCGMILMAGCVNTQYQKEVTVTKDKDGNVVSRVETERAIQFRDGLFITFDHLKGVDPYGK